MATVAEGSGLRACFRNLYDIGRLRMLATSIPRVISLLTNRPQIERSQNYIYSS